jgi:hypothetical protein
MKHSLHKLRIVSYLLVTLATGPLIAQGPNASGFPRDLAPDSTTILGITLGRSNLANVRAKFGPAKLRSDGDASTAERRLCYLTREPNPLAIIFASNAEMAPSQEVTDIRILKGNDYTDRSQCLRLVIGADQIRTTSGLEIGISRESFVRFWGHPLTIAKRNGAMIGK